MPDGWAGRAEGLPAACEAGSDDGFPVGWEGGWPDGFVAVGACELPGWGAAAQKAAILIAPPAAAARLLNATAFWRPVPWALA
jgi:hypothetical protein